MSKLVSIDMRWSAIVEVDDCHRDLILSLMTLNANAKRMATRMAMCAAWAEAGVSTYRSNLSRLFPRRGFTRVKLLPSTGADNYNQ